MALFPAVCPVVETCKGSRPWDSRPELLSLGKLFPLYTTDFSFDPGVSFPFQHCLQLKGTGGFWS